MNDAQQQDSQEAAGDCRIPSPFQKKTCWYALTGVAILVMLCIAAFVIFEVVKLLGFLEPVLLPILIAAVVAYLLEPIVSWLVHFRFSRPWAVVTVMFAALAVLVGFGATILPPLIRQTDELIDNRMELWDKTSELIDSTIEIPFISRTIDSVYSTSLRELNTGHYTDAEVHDLRNARTAREKLGAYMTINSAFYFLLEADKIREKWPSILPLKASKFRKDVVDTMEEINGYLISFFRGQMLVSIIEGILIAICLKLLGLPYAVTIGAAVCVLGIVPYLGIITAFIPAVLLAWFTWGDFQHVLIVSGIFLAVNQFDGWVIQPKIVGDSVELHPLTVMFSVLIWTLILGGLIGTAVNAIGRASLNIDLEPTAIAKKRANQKKMPAIIAGESSATRLMRTPFGMPVLSESSSVTSCPRMPIYARLTLLERFSISFLIWEIAMPVTTLFPLAL